MGSLKVFLALYSIENHLNLFIRIRERSTITLHVGSHLSSMNKDSRSMNTTHIDEVKGKAQKLAQVFMDSVGNLDVSGLLVIILDFSLVRFELTL